MEDASYRPISLLNTNTKILAQVLAHRLEDIIHQIISNYLTLLRIDIPSPCQTPSFPKEPATDPTDKFLPFYPLSKGPLSILYQKHFMQADSSLDMMKTA